MEKPFLLDVNVLLSCSFFWCYIYFAFTLLLEMISLSFYAGVLLITAAIGTYGCLWYFSVPRPQNAQVIEILGSDLKLMKFRKSSLEFSYNSANGDEERFTDDKDFFTVIGHRGAGLDAPENSLSAFKQCQEKGCKAVEFDVVLTADGVPVLFHDDSVDRLTNSTGLVQHMTWDQLKALDISEKHPLQERFVGERIALLSDVVKFCVESDIRMIIDVKDDNPKIVQVLLDTFKECPKMYKRAMVSAFNPFIIYMLRSRDPQIVCSLAWRPYYFSCSAYGRDVEHGLVRRYSSWPMHIAARIVDCLSTWLLHNVGYFMLGLSAILLHKDVVTSDVISFWEKRNMRVIIWTVNRPQEKMYFSRVLRLAYITDTLATERNGPLL